MKIFVKVVLLILLMALLLFSIFYILYRFDKKDCLYCDYSGCVEKCLDVRESEKNACLEKGYVHGASDLEVLKCLLAIE